MPQPLKTGMFLPLATFACTMALGCGGPESGTLTVQYQLGPAAMDDCEQYEVDEVEATLGDDEYVTVVNCGDEVVFPEVEAGVWDLLVEGHNRDGLVVMDNDGGERIEVVAGNARTVEAQLIATPVSVFVNWILEIDGTPGIQCSNPMNPFAEFEVVAWDQTAARLATHVFQCDAAPDSGAFRKVPDDSRSLRGNLLQEVSVQPNDADGNDVGSNGRFILPEPPGPGRDLYLTLRCDIEDETCVAQGEPPYDSP